MTLRLRRWLSVLRRLRGRAVGGALLQPAAQAGPLPLQPRLLCRAKSQAPRGGATTTTCDNNTCQYQCPPLRTKTGVPTGGVNKPPFSVLDGPSPPKPAAEHDDGFDPQPTAAGGRGGHLAACRSGSGAVKKGQLRPAATAAGTSADLLLRRRTVMPPTLCRRGRTVRGVSHPRTPPARTAFLA